MDPKDARFLAGLVHLGFVSGTAMREALAGAREGESPPDLLARFGLMAAEEAERLRANRLGAEPSFTRYERLELLGEGRTARVFAVRDRRDGRTYAVKLCREEQARDPKRLRRFLEEARLLCELEHPGLLKGYRLARDHGQYFLVMELIRGEDLERALERDGPFAEDALLDIARQVARTLRFLRERGLVHRDLKPGNLLRDGDGRIVLCDLGFAVREGDLRGGGRTVGTIAYISPEQARGLADLDARADIYSLGATLFHLATGEPPFGTGEDPRTLRSQVGEPLSTERLRAFRLSPLLHYFLEKMLAKDREIRFQTPDEILAELAEKWRPETDPATPPSPTARTSPSRRRRRPAAGRRPRRRRR